MKAVRRKNKSDRLRKLRRNDNIPRQPHLPLVDQLGSTEHKIRKEIAIMKKLNHPHVVRLLEVIDDPLNDKIYMGMFRSPFLYTPHSHCTISRCLCPFLHTPRMSCYALSTRLSKVLHARHGTL